MKKRQTQYILSAMISVLVLFVGCSSQTATSVDSIASGAETSASESTAIVEPSAEIAAETDSGEFDYLPQQRALAVLWQQESGEAKALRYQAYNTAKIYIDQVVANGLSGNEAVVLDIDETVLDNVPFAAQLVYDNLNYSSDLWNAWVDRADAEEVHGASEFIRYVQENGIAVFLVSNRKEEAHGDATEKNLINVGINIPRENIMLRTDESDKQPRFNLIGETHNIIMYVGDNLIDFPGDYNSRSNAERSEIVVNGRNDYGTKYIVLPNPMNGDFEAALVDYDQARPGAEILEIRERALAPFQ